MGINNVETFVSQWSQWLQGNVKPNLEVTDKVSQQAIEILQNRPKDNARPVIATLNQFEFSDEQRQKIYAALSGTDSTSLQVKKLLQSNTPFNDFADTYTLKFADGELKASKAELSTYGQYFITRFNLGIPNKEIHLSEIEMESFNAIKSFVRGEINLDAIDPESLDALKELAAYFSVAELEKLLCKTVGEAISIANKYEWQEIDLTKYEGELTDQDINQILSLRSLRRIEEIIDLKALFPKLSIIDETVWKAHADMAANGLDADKAIDIRAAIHNLHQMYRTLKIEGDAGITLLKMPKGLTLNKLLAIAKESLHNPIGCDYIWDEIVKTFGDTPLTEGYTLAITDSVLEKSRNLSVSAQQELVQNYGCNMPALLEMMALTLMTYVSSSDEPPKRLYGDSPWTYSRVVEIIRAYHLVVGGFSPSGLNVGSRYVDDRIGVAGLRKF